MNKSFTEQVTEKAKGRILALLDRKPEEKKPSNVGLILAWLGFNAIYLLLDIGTSAMVWALTNPFYALLTFLAGIAPFVINEALFVRAWNSINQKRLAIIGAGVSLVITIGLAVVVAVINAIKYFQITTSEWISFSLEITLLIGIVGGASLHGLIWLIYFFTDPGILANQTHTQTRAERIQQKQDLAFAKEDIQDAILMSKEFEDAEKNNLLEALASRLGVYMGKDMSKMVLGSDVEQVKLKDRGNHPQSGQP